MKRFNPKKIINFQWVEFEGIIKVPRLLAIIIVSRVCSDQKGYNKYTMVRSVLSYG